MGYIILKEKEREKITINNDFSFLFLLSQSGQPKKISVDKLFEILSDYGEETTLDEIKSLTFKYRRN